jgi:hypothetical protein
MEQDHLLIVEVGDLFDEMADAIAEGGELPAHILDNGNTDAFLMDLYQAVGYRPEGTIDLKPNVRDVLDASHYYFDVLELSPLQRQLWHTFMDRLLVRFDEFKLYDGQHMHRYDYHRLHGDVLLLKLAEV